MINSEKNFTVCHSVVPPDPYYEACLHESCLCSKGGDCACFCAAVASYVRACNQHGVSILWRREGFCGKSVKSLNGFADVNYLMCLFSNLVIYNDFPGFDALSWYWYFLFLTLPHLPFVSTLGTQHSLFKTCGLHVQRNGATNRSWIKLLPVMSFDKFDWDSEQFIFAISTSQNSQFPFFLGIKGGGEGANKVYCGGYGNGE